MKKVAEIKSTFEHLFDQPSNFTVDDRGNVYVLNDLKENVMVFNGKGRYLRSFGNATIKGIDIYKAYSITCDDYNLLHIYEPYQGSILTIDTAGVLKKVTPLDFGEEEGAEVQHNITDLSFMFNNYYLVDNNTHTLYVFNPRGKLVNKVGVKGELKKEFNKPYSLAFDNEGKLYITDVLNSRVQSFTSTGAFLNQISEFGFTDGGIFRPNGVAVDNNMNVYISDSFLGVVYVFDSDGNYISPLMENGKMLKLKSPTRMRIKNNKLHILEMQSNKINIYEFL